MGEAQIRASLSEPALLQAMLTLSRSVMSDGYTSECSTSYWSNPHFL